MVLSKDTKDHVHDLTPAVEADLSDDSFKVFSTFATTTLISPLWELKSKVFLFTQLVVHHISFAFIMSPFFHQSPDSSPHRAPYVQLKAERVKKIWQLHSNQPAGEGGPGFRWPEAGSSLAQDYVGSGEITALSLSVCVSPSFPIQLGKKHSASLWGIFSHHISRFHIILVLEFARAGWKRLVPSLRIQT